MIYSVYIWQMTAKTTRRLHGEKLGTRRSPAGLTMRMHEPRVCCDAELRHARRGTKSRRLLAERLLERRLGCLGQRPVPLRRADLLDGVERPA